MPDIKFILDKSDGTVIMPLRPRDLVGREEAFVVRSIAWLQANLSTAQKDKLVAWLGIPYAERPERLYPNAKLPLTTAQKSRWRRRLKQRRGQNTAPARLHYFYDSVNDKAIEQGNPVTFDDARMLKTVGTGLEARQVPADPIDDGRYQGPYTAPDALALRVNPPVGGP